MTPNETFLVTMRDAAKAAGHVWPEYAAAEAALETAGTALPGVPQSNFGRDETYTLANNIFGNKAPAKLPEGMQTVNIPTREFISGQYQMVPANWIKFNAYTDAFTYRMQLLKRLPIYAAALAAPNGEEFVRMVSARWQQVLNMAPDGKMSFQFGSGVYRWLSGLWSTGPARAHEVILIYTQHKDLLDAPTPPTMEIA